MTLGVDAFVIAGGVFLARLALRVLRHEAGAGSRAKPPRELESDLFEGFACRLGDVVVRRLDADDLWLQGAVVFSEERPVATLFVGPEARGVRAVFVPAPPETRLTWLSPVRTSEIDAVTPEGEPLRAIEHERTYFERRRRIPVRVDRLGACAPDVGARAIVAEYETPAPKVENLVVVSGTNAVLVWRGVSLAKGDYDVLPGGAATLEP